MRSFSWRRTVRIIAVLSWVVAIAWLIVEPGFEPLLAFLGGVTAFVASSAAGDAPISRARAYRLTPEQRQRNRHAMLELVRNAWVKGVLEQSLHGAAMMELGLEERVGAVEREYPWDMVLQMPDRPNRTLPPGTRIVEVFNEMNRALLILGEPGSGKTTMLLELARDTIALAEQDPTQPIPVVFNLSSWSEKRQSISDWLVDELYAKYSIPREIARPWVENDDLLLLLDGLDEVAQEYREACIETINDFRQEHGVTPIVVCSRVADYEALTTRLKLQGAVLLQPLTPQQVDQYLERTGAELLAARTTLQHDSTLQELAQSPLMLNVMTLAYRGMPVKDLGSLDSIDARRRHVLDAYVERMFKRRGANQPYSREQTIGWLVWLAHKMSQHAQTVFLIEWMQPGWLETRTQAWLYTATFGLSMLPFGMVFVPGGISFSRIAPVEALKWSHKQARKLLPIVVSLGAAFGLAFWLFSGLVSWLISWLTSGLIFGDRAGLRTGLRVGLGVALGIELISVLMSGLTHAEVETRATPSQGIGRSARNAAIVALSIWLIFGSVWLVFGLGPELIIVPILGLLLGLHLGLLFGGAAFIQHSLLRFILFCNGHIPWNYARFLDYAAERNFLRKVGGGYMFIHRLLQDHFASLDQAANHRAPHHPGGTGC